MQDNITIARPYARAVFELAQEEGNLEQWTMMLKTLAVVVQDDDMRRVISSPRVSHDQVLNLAGDVLGNTLFDNGRNFIKVLIHSNRLRLVPYISDLFDKRRADAEGRIDINVTSAYEINQDQSAMISAAMGRRLGKKVSVFATVDQSLIGGVIIRAGDSVIDASLRGRLTELHNSLVG